MSGWTGWTPFEVEDYGPPPPLPFSLYVCSCNGEAWPDKESCLNTREDNIILYRNFYYPKMQVFDAAMEYTITNTRGDWKNYAQGVMQWFHDLHGPTYYEWCKHRTWLRNAEADEADRFKRHFPGNGRRLWEERPHLMT